MSLPSLSTRIHGIPALPLHRPRLRPFDRGQELLVVLAATFSVSILPVLAVQWLLSPRGAAGLVASAALAVVISAVAGRLGAAAWSRLPGTHPTVFADLMLWRWARYRWAEWRLSVLEDRLNRAQVDGDLVPLASMLQLARLLEARDPSTYGHSRRVAHHAQMIGRQLGLSRADVERVRLAALVHDVGKVFTPVDILTKPGSLTDVEFEVIKLHTEDGAQMLGEIAEPAIVAMVRHHHERLDGSGYPDRLSGDEIPLGAQIIAVADTFDALTSARPYRRALTHQRALEILAAEAGTKLDRRAVEAFVDECSEQRTATGTAALAVVARRLIDWIGAGTPGIASSAPALVNALPAAAVVAVAALAPAASTAISSGSRSADPDRAVVGASAHHAARARASAPATLRATTGTAAAQSTASSSATREEDPRDRVARRRDGPNRVASQPAPPTPPRGADRSSTSLQQATATAQPNPPTATGQPASDGAQRGLQATVPAVAAPQADLPATPATPARTPTVTTPAVTTTVAGTPAVTTPAVTTPAVTTPAVTMPVGAVPPTTVPAVTVPAVTVPAVTVPQLAPPAGER